MELALHPNMIMQRQFIGQEKAPLLIIDNFVANPDDLIEEATRLQFTTNGTYFPGIRAVAPIAYQQFLLTQLTPTLNEFFELNNLRLGYSLCHYSLVTTPAKDLIFVQTIPHIDSIEGQGLASIHYLFKDNLGGTAFYRHRKTGFEVINPARKEFYLNTLGQLRHEPFIKHTGYINGDNDLFEQVAKVDGVFNRLVVYRKNSLHSGSIDPHFVPDPNPRTGRLSINSFIEVHPG